MDAYVGIDIGGSHIGVAMYDSKGESCGHARMELDGSSVTNEELTRHLVKIIRQLSSMVAKELKVIAMGIGSPGPLDPTKGIIKNPPNLPNIKDLMIVENIKREFPEIPAFLINDADAAVLGEVWFGSAQGFKDVVMLTLGTGIGSGIIADGKLQRGRGMGGEWGHTSIYSAETRICSCGKKNCLEIFCSTEGLTRTYCQRLGLKRSHLSSDFVHSISRRMMRLKDVEYKWGDIFEAYCRDLTKGVLNIINVHHPDCIVLGGGIANSFIVESVKTKLCEDVSCKFRPLLEGLEIRISANFQSGIIGATKHAMDCSEAIIKQHRADHGAIS